MVFPDHTHLLFGMFLSKANDLATMLMFRVLGFGLAYYSTWIGTTNDKITYFSNGGGGGNISLLHFTLFCTSLGLFSIKQFHMHYLLFKPQLHCHDFGHDGATTHPDLSSRDASA